MSRISKCDAAICRNGQAEAAPADEDLKRGQDIDCGICREVIYEKENEMERYFGILTHCDHTFCYDCIARWRQQSSRVQSAALHPHWRSRIKSGGMQTSRQQKNSPWYRSISQCFGRQHRFQEDNQLLRPDLHLWSEERHRTSSIPHLFRLQGEIRTSEEHQQISRMRKFQPEIQTLDKQHQTSSIPRPFRFQQEIQTLDDHQTSSVPHLLRFQEEMPQLGTVPDSPNRRGERMNNQPTSAAARSSMPSTLLPPEIAARFPPDTQRRLEAALRRGQRLEDIINPAVLGLARGIRQ